jgi:hypothetical protein
VLWPLLIVAGLLLDVILGFAIFAAVVAVWRRIKRAF